MRRKSNAESRDRDEYIKGPLIRVYMDESGNGNESQPLIVGAVVADLEASEIEARIQDLYRDLSVSRSWAGLPSFEEFRATGFHASSDPWEVSGPFLALIQEGGGFKAYMLMTDRTNVPTLSENERIAMMYEVLLGDLLIRYHRSSEIVCYIEQNDGLRGLAQTLPAAAKRRALARLDREAPLPKTTVSMVRKTEVMSMAIVDYIMHAVSGWIRSAYQQEPKDRKYRAFREVEPLVSLLYSLERGRLVSRSMPLH